MLLLILFSSSCQKESSSNPVSDPIGGESCGELETSLSTYLNSYSTSTDFSLYLEREDGYSYTFNKGSSTLDTAYESASTSKWVSAALILWVLNKEATFNLTDIPSDHYSWSMLSSESIYNATLSQLLSFTSGFESEASCLRLGVPSKTFDACIDDTSGSIVSGNSGEGYTTGTSFHYSSSHLQIAGAMAIEAGSYTSWQDLFTSFKAETSLFSSSTYSLPSTTNPRLSGGMTWTTRDYASFLKALYHNDFIGESLRSTMFSDQVGNLTISYSPAFDGLGEQWHYGYGTWLECESSVYNCSSIDYYSSPGAYGAYPFINLNKKFFGIVGREGSLGTYTEGINLYRSVRSIAEAWASCSE